MKKTKCMADGGSAKELTDRIAREENEADKAAFDRYVINPVKRVGQAAKDYLIGTEDQNKAAAEKMKAEDELNPGSAKARINKAIGYGGYKKGGTVSSASKRADGCAIRGKTKGRIL